MRSAEHKAQRDMTVFDTPKPVEPKPTDFGLTKERINEFNRSSGFSLIIALMVCVVAAVYVLNQNPLELLNVPILFLFIFLPLEAIEAIWCAIWRHRQPDYEKFRSFQTALESYDNDLQQWRREQSAWWQSLSGWRFEAELARLFERRGYETRNLGGAGDEGIDLILRKDGSEILVQCKAHARPVGPGAVRDLYGAMMHKRAEEAWLVSTMGFSQAAKKFAAGKPLRLIRIEEILRETS
jgi:hypothetical protein